MASHIKKLFTKTSETFKNLRYKLADMKKKREAPVIIHAPVAPAKPQKTQLEISSGTMARFVAITILLLLVTAFLYEIRDILVIFFVSLLFAAALDPMVDALERRKIPRSLGVIIIYLVVIFVLGFIISNLVPIVAREVAQLATKTQDFITNIVNGKIELPAFMNSFKPTITKFFEGINVAEFGNYKDILLKIADQLSSVAGNVFNAVLVIFNGFVNTILVFVLTFLMTVEEDGIEKFILSLFPGRHAAYIRQKSNAIKEKMGYWLRGQIVLCFVVGLCVYVGFLIIGLVIGKPVEYAATIALVAGLTELIPYIGPFLAWLIAMPVMANQSLMLIVWMTILMYIVQTLENNLIVPMVMHRAVGISPIFVMFAMLIGFSFLGILGMILAVPVATTVAIFLKDYADREK